MRDISEHSEVLCLWAADLCDILRELVALCETNGFLLAVSKEQIVRPCSS